MNSIETFLLSSVNPAIKEHIEKDSCYGIPYSVLNKDKEFKKEILNISIDPSISTEHYIALFATKSNEAVIMSHYFNNMVKNRYRRVRTIQEIVKSKANRSREAAEDLIHVYSIESAGEFFKNVIDGVATLIKKVIAAIVSFIKMIANTVRSKLASLQNSFYDKNKDKIKEALAENGSRLCKYKSYQSNITKDSAKIQIDYFYKLSEEISKLCTTDFDKTEEINEKTKNALQFIAKKLDDGATRFLDKNLGKDDTPKTMVNQLFYGEKKIPKATEKPIKDLLTEDSFKVCSKEWLDNLNKMPAIAKLLNKSCSNLLDRLQKVSKPISKEKGDDNKESRELAKQNISKISKLRLLIQYHQHFIYDYFWASLDYRSTIYKLAKTCIKGKGKTGDDNDPVKNPEIISNAQNKVNDTKSK